MSVRFALTRTTTEALATVAATASTLTTSVNAVNSLAHSLAAQAEDYRETTERDLAASRTQRTIRRSKERAREDAMFHADLHKELAADPMLKEYFDKALEAYQSADEEVTLRLRSVS
jgi:hypothetical protein